MNDRTNGFEDGRDYMRVKKSKLAAQNDKIRESLRSRNSTLRTDLFKGISINVNGRTQPTADELKRLILLNGGDYHPYYRYQTTKFMIATNLSAARIKNLRPDDRVVRPEWITESISAKCLLPYEDYQLFADEPRGDGSVLAIEPSRGSQSPGKRRSVTNTNNNDRPSTTISNFLIVGGTRPDTSNALGQTTTTRVPEKRPPSKGVTMSDFVIRSTKPIRPSPKVLDKPAAFQSKKITDLNNRMSIDDAISLLNDWVGCPEGITSEAKTCVTRYFEDLMIGRDYHNKFYEIIAALQQRVMEHDELSWITFYNNMVGDLRNKLNQNIEATQNLYQLITLIESSSSD